MKANRHYSWTQPICTECFGKRNPGREPTQLVDHMRSEETCSVCGATTRDGIYFRVDPATVDWPTNLKDD